MITKKGVIVKRSGDKTVKVEINDYRSHPKYKKRYRITKRLLVHDEKNVAQVGETVVIMQCRPQSKKKNWILTDAA
jgi:small subunit ribosomal protein S17